MAISYLQHDIAAAEREQKEIREAFRTAKLPDHDGHDDAEFWARRPYEYTPEGKPRSRRDGGYCRGSLVG